MGSDSTDSVILASGGYDHTIRFWTAHNGNCQRIVQHPDSVNIICLFFSLILFASFQIKFLH